MATTPSKIAEYVRICREKTDALEHLVVDLFAYARIEYLEQTVRRAIGRGNAPRQNGARAAARGERQRGDA